MNMYHVYYYNSKGNEKIYKVKANNKQEAYKMFKQACDNKFNVIKIINCTSVLAEKLVIAGIALLIVAFIVVSAYAIVHNWNDPEPVDYVEYVVEPGDTLWGIARNSDKWNKMDASIIIDDMCEASNCTATIYPGQVVYIPMYEN